MSNDDLLLDNLMVPSSSLDDNDANSRKRSAQRSKNTPKKTKPTTPTASRQLAAKGKTKVSYTYKEEDDDDYVPIEEPKGAVKKLWTDKDEITLLKALKKQTNKLDMTMLFNSVNTCLEAQVSKRQLSEKVRKLRNKFTNGLGKDVELLDDHQAKVHKLCEEVWGELRRMSKHDFRVRYPRIDSCINDMYPHGNLTEDGSDLLRTCMAALSRKELDDLEDGWIEYHLEEIEHGNKRMVLIEKQSKLIEKATMAYKSKKR